ncbi:MAG: cytochrome c family protein [Desulfobacterales bacterium]|nr:cytochrome c family protein [Desulfobacterales bacterium]
MKPLQLFLVILCILLPLTVAAKNAGQAQHTLYGGKSGQVPFPHHQHQSMISDCMTCHAAFPQEAGSLDSLKKQGSLKKKQVMNKTCLKCHRSLKKAGKPTGPTKCNGCHIK